MFSFLSRHCFPQFWIHSHQTTVLWWLTESREFLDLHHLVASDHREQRTALPCEFQQKSSGSTLIDLLMSCAHPSADPFDQRRELSGLGLLTQPSAGWNFSFLHHLNQELEEGMTFLKKEMLWEAKKYVSTVSYRCHVGKNDTKAIR